MNGRSLLGPAGALGPHLACSHSAGQTGTQLSTRILPIHLSHLPIKCTVSSATGAQPAAENPPAITPSLGGRPGRLRGAQPPPGASAGPGTVLEAVLVEPWLVWFPTCPCMWLSIVSGPPSGACALAAVSMVTAAPGEEHLAGCWGWQDPRLPPDPPET